MVLHRRQFIICPKACQREDFLSFQLEDGVVLSFQKELPYSVIDRQTFLLGDAIQTSSLKGSPEEELAKNDDLFETTYSFSGRWTVIKGDIILTDPCALAPIFFSCEKRIASSSLALIHEMFPEIERTAGVNELVPKADWYPVPLTPLEGIRRLLPGQWLQDFTLMRRQLVCPPMHLPECDNKDEGLLSSIVESFDCFFRNAEKKYNGIYLSMSGGTDSRALFALAKHSGVKFSCFTLDFDCARCDKEVPKKICEIYDVPLLLVPPGPQDKSLSALWDEHTFNSCSSVDREFLACGQYAVIPLDALLIRGNIWEITAHYWFYKFRQVPLGDNEKVINAIRESFPELVKGDFNIRSLKEWVEDISINPRNMDWRDLFITEQRQSGWLGYIEQGLDLIGPSHFQPMDCQATLSAAFALSDSLRNSRRYEEIFVERFTPEAAKIPYNALTFSEKVKDYAKKLSNLSSFSEIIAGIRKRL